MIPTVKVLDCIPLEPGNKLHSICHDTLRGVAEALRESASMNTTFILAEKATRTGLWLLLMRIEMKVGVKPICAIPDTEIQIAPEFDQRVPVWFDPGLTDKARDVLDQFVKSIGTIIGKHVELLRLENRDVPLQEMLAP